MDTANVILNQVVPILMIPVNNYLRYLVSSTKYMRDMGIKMKELDVARVGVEEHIMGNTSMNLEVPAQVNVWLKDIEKIKEKVEKVPSDFGSCFNLKIRHRTGRNAFYITEEIESLMKQHSSIIWNDRPIPLGRVDSKKASTSTLSSEHNDSSSREVTFMEALKALRPTNKSHMVALSGIPGVGKTTMMIKLKETVDQKKMFKYIIPVVLGVKVEPISIQTVVATYLGMDLKEEDKSVRADRLRQEFKAKSEGGKNKFLIILDDVWQSIDLKDIGLSTFPNQGVDFKVLLTSRDRQVCADMGVEFDSILNVELLTEAESQSLFRQISGTSDPELHKIGDDIVRKCHGLPIAIKTIACTLKYKRKDAWNDALSRLEYHDVDIVNEVFKLSYENLQGEETKSILLLCGLYPEDVNIPTEELARYGWGLKLFKKVYTIREARNRLNTCIDQLIQKNLLLESDGWCVKMHDLVLSFVLNMFSKVEQASIVNHGNMLGWPESDMDNSSCKRISITCNNVFEIPKYLKFTNLSILKLMHGDKALTFPLDFYREMEYLQVISYDKMKYPLIPSSPQCTTNLRVLHLNECSLTSFNCSSIGNLLNLEVLSFANSGIEWLPSTIGNLKKLRLLDLTNCYGLRIDNGVIKQLVKLEELYMRVVGGNGKMMNLTDDNCNEITEISKNLLALEFQFFENSAQPKNMSFEKLQRFMISLGSCLNENFNETNISSENMLLLVTNKGEVLESRMNELFEKTGVLELSVGDINDLGELVEVKSFSRPPQSSSFYNLRVLFVSKCEELRYLFTLDVANTLKKLEHLVVTKCNNLEELIHMRGSEKESIIFPNLKSLSLSELPKLLGLCGNVNIELPELVMLTLEHIPGITSIYPNKLETSSLLKEEVVIPKLKELNITGLENLKNIWPCEFSTSDEVNLRVIQVRDCDKLVNIFPCNPMSLLHHLKELIVRNCGSVEVLFNIDLDSIGEFGEGSKLSGIFVENLGKLRELWRIKGTNKSCVFNHGFHAVESIYIHKCVRFRNVFTPITINFDMGALIKLSITKSGTNDRNNKATDSCQEQEQTDIISKEEMSQVDDNLSNVAFPSSLIHSFHNLHELEVKKLMGVEVLFEIERSTSRESVTNHHNQQRLLPYLEQLNLTSLNSMSHVWKCNWNKFLILQKSPFHNLTTIYVQKCKSIRYLFSPLMAKLLSNLKEVHIRKCDGIEEIVSNRDDEDEEITTFTYTSSHISTTLFPHLDSISLSELDNLKWIGGGRVGGGNNEISFNNATITTASVDQFKFSEAGGVSWSLCQYAREISISFCDALSSVIPCYAAGQMQKLQVLKIEFCEEMKELFESTQGMNNKSSRGSGCDEGSVIPRLNNVITVPNLKILNIIGCHGLEHVFTFSALKNLRQLQELSIKNCEAMKLVVKKEEEEDDEGQTTTTTKWEVVVFPCLKSIVLEDLPELEGFFLGKNDFQCPSLDYVNIKKCPKMMVFASGGSTSPKLKYMQTNLGKHSLEECGLNFHVPITTAHQQTPLFPSLYPATSVGMRWSFHNLIELHVNDNESVKTIIPSNELLQLQKLKKIHVSNCASVKKVFEAVKPRINDESETTTLVKLPNLTQVDLMWIRDLKYIWKNNQWTMFEFPNLTTLSIKGCVELEHVFTSSMVGSLLQLEELRIEECYTLHSVFVINAYVKKNEIELPRLKSLTLNGLPRLWGFCLEKVDFSLPLLDTLIIKECPAITFFTEGNSATPELKEIETNFGLCYVQEDINSIVEMKQEEFKKFKPWWM